MPPERAAFCCLCPDRSAHRQQSDLIRGGPFAPSSAPAALSSCPESHHLSKTHAAQSRAAFSFAAALFYHPARVQVYRFLSAHRLCYPKKGGTAMILALAGNPNCGKTTLFNALTGANARTGNFPGVTVTRSEGVCRARPEITLVDLPGVYALRPYSDEERVTRSYLLGGAAGAQTLLGHDFLNTFFCHNKTPCAPPGAQNAHLSPALGRGCACIKTVSWKLTVTAIVVSRPAGSFLREQRRVAAPSSRFAIACVLLAAAPTATPCFRHWRRSLQLQNPRFRPCAYARGPTSRTFAGETPSPQPLVSGNFIRCYCGSVI